MPDMYYTKTHEWVSLEGDIASLGLTKYAVEQLTDIVYIELQPVGTVVEPGDTLGEVESVKSVENIYAPIGGEILEHNDNAVESPELISADPENVWIVKFKVSSLEKNGLLSLDEYLKLIDEE